MLGLQLWKTFKSSLIQVGRLCARTYTAIKSFLEESLFRFLFPFQWFQISNETENLKYSKTTETKEDFERGEKFLRGCATEEEKRDLFETYFAPQSGIEECDEEEVTKTIENSKQTLAFEIPSDGLPELGSEYLEDVMHELLYDNLHLSKMFTLSSLYYFPSTDVFQEIDLSIYDYCKLPLNYIPDDDASIFEYAMFPTFFDNPVRTQTKVVKVQSAWVPLGQTETCDCWMRIPAHSHSKTENVIYRHLFPNYKECHSGWFIHPVTGKETNIILIRDNIVHYLEEIDSAVGSRTFLYRSATDCHLLEEAGFAGHDVRDHVQIYLEPGAGGQWRVIKATELNLTRSLSLWEGLELAQQSQKLSPAPLMRKVFKQTKGSMSFAQVVLRSKGMDLGAATYQEHAKRYEELNYIPPAPSHLVSIDEISADWLERYAFIVELYLDEVEYEIGSRYVPVEWTEVVQSVWTDYYKPYDLSNSNMVILDRWEAPRCVKKRIAKLKTRLHKAAYTCFKIRMQPNKSFIVNEASTIEDARNERYALAAELSMKATVKACPRFAREWLKMNRAQHMLNQVVISGSRSDTEGSDAMAKFNYEFKKRGGVNLPYPTSRIQDLKARLETVYDREREQKRAAKLMKQQIENERINVSMNKVTYPSKG